MNPFHTIVYRMGNLPESDVEIAKKMFDRVKHIPGWSNEVQCAFFRYCLEYLPDNASVLLCGVYHGRDLKMLSLAGEHLGRKIKLTGVDLFSAEPCADWTDEQCKIGSWEENGFGPPPNEQWARENCPGAEIVKGDSYNYMSGIPWPSCDFIYLDTSHDYETVMQEILMARSCIKPGGIIAGDDYKGEPHWGVKRAVDESFKSIAVFGDTIWMARP